MHQLLGYSRELWKPPPVREGLRVVDRSSVVLSTKTTSSSYDGARLSLKNALEELGTQYLDIYYLHSVQSPQDLEDRKGALKAFMEAKSDGFVRHVGISTHWSRVVEKALEILDIQIVMMNCPLDAMLRAASLGCEPRLHRVHDGPQDLDLP